MSLATLRHLPQHQQKQLLGVITYGDGNHLPDGSAPVLQVPSQVFAEDGEAADNAWVCEAWLHEGGSQEMQSALLSLECGGEMHYRHDGDYLFGTVTLPEFVPAGDTTTPPLQHAAELAYQQIFSLLDTYDYQHVYRFWNYIADINSISHGQERYRQFNIGRQDAFLASHRALTGQLPAACALGIPSGPLRIAFLAGRRSAQAVENPRQVSAYEYPEVYGPRSPSFSRATLLRTDAGQQHRAQDILFISGTASIVGHETLHAGDVVAQTRETLANLQALIAHAQNEHTQNHHAHLLQSSEKTAQQTISVQVFDTQHALYRVYLRNLQDMLPVKQEVLRVFGEHAHILFLQADVCRDDLLLEIEVTLFSLPSSPDMEFRGGLVSPS